VKNTFDSIACITLDIVGIILTIYNGNTGGDTIFGLTRAITASLTFEPYAVLGKLKAEEVSIIAMLLSEQHTLHIWEY
jgi:drug/metabolite transporter (DMT)-like permease